VSKQTQPPVPIRIKLPLEADVASTLLKVIGLTYPRTVIGNDEHTHNHEREMVLLVDQRDRHRSPKARKRYQEVKDHAEGWGPHFLTELGPNAVGVTPHEVLIQLWVQLARQSFEMWPDAQNYLESTAYDPQTRIRYVFTVSKSDRQTPHALRTQAEATVAELRAEVAELKRQLEDRDA